MSNEFVAEGFTSLSQDLGDNLMGVSDLTGEEMMSRAFNAASVNATVA